MKLYTYFRSSAAFRVRIALNLKGLGYEPAFVHLAKGEHRGPEYAAVNPQALVPALEDGGRIFSQSLAIIEYLDERFLQPALLPADPADRALVRSMALLIACEVHPIQNLRVLVYLKRNLNQSDEALNRWAQHWINLGLSALEQMQGPVPRRGAFSFGDTPTLADICLVPQLANARRFGLDLSPFPRLVSIERNCLALPAFADAAPAQQPDAE